MTTRKTGPSLSEMGQKRVDLVQNRANFGIFSTFWIFPEQQVFLWEVWHTYRFQEESEPVILSYFLWHFIVEYKDFNVLSDNSPGYGLGGPYNSKITLNT